MKLLGLPVGQAANSTKWGDMNILDAWTLLHFARRFKNLSNGISSHVPTSHWKATFTHSNKKRRDIQEPQQHKIGGHLSGHILQASILLHCSFLRPRHSQIGGELLSLISPLLILLTLLLHCDKSSFWALPPLVAHAILRRGLSLSMWKVYITSAIVQPWGPKVQNWAS